MTNTTHTPLTERYGNECRWVNWRLVPDAKGKLTKVPYQPNGRKASTTDSKTWSTLAAVQQAQGFNGYGIVFTPDMLLLGVDLDHVLDADGMVDDEASVLFLQKADSNAEFSFSMDGVHDLIELTAPFAPESNAHKPNEKIKYECYTKGRFFTVTGKGYGEWGDKPIRKVTPQEAAGLLGILGYPWGKQPKTETNGKVHSNSNSNGQPAATEGDDVSLLERIRDSKQGSKFAALYDHGDLSLNNNDASSADLALCQILAFWTRRDAARVDRLFRQSALMRDKWDTRHYGDGRTYGQGTVDKAIENQSEELKERGAQSKYVNPGPMDQLEPGDEHALDDVPAPENPPPDSAPAKSTLPKAIAKAVGDLERLTCDDIGNGYRFADQHRHEARYVDVWGWMVYDGKRWRRDVTGAIMRMAKLTAKRIWDESIAAQKVARNGDDKDAARATNLAKWAAKSRSSDALSAMLRQAQSELSAEPEDFDQDPMLLNVQNGTVDLATGTLRKHDPDDLITKICNASYEKDALAPLWTATLDRFLPAVYRPYMKRSLGLAASGQPLKAFWFLFGEGDNGKSTITSAAAHVLGDYAVKINVEALMGKRRSAGDEDHIAHLAGARFVLGNEVDSGSLNQKLIKDLTGESDTIRTKFFGTRTFTFKPQFKLFIYGNQRPKLDSTDGAFWNRVQCVPFEKSIPKAEQIKDFASKLKAEASGILAYLVEGCMECLRDGLNPPAEIVQAGAEYRAETDDLAQFLSACCIVRPEVSAKFADLHPSYEKFSGQKITPFELSKQLKKRGFEPGTGPGGARIYIGVGLPAEQKEHE